MRRRKPRADGNANADAYLAVNAIRQRAGLAGLSGLANNAFIDAVVQERAWEFAGEYTRWFDLVRPGAGRGVPIPARIPMNFQWLEPSPLQTIGYPSLPAMFP